MNLKFTYIRRLWIIALILSASSLHADIFDLFNLKGLKGYPLDLQNKIAKYMAEQTSRAYLPIIFDCGKQKDSVLIHEDKSCWRFRQLHVKLWAMEKRDWYPMPLGAGNMDAKTLFGWSTRGTAFPDDENPSKIQATVGETYIEWDVSDLENCINGRDFTIDQMLLIKLLYATKKEGNATSFSVIAQYNPQVCEEELWFIFETFSDIMQSSLASKYELVC